MIKSGESRYELPKNLPAGVTQDVPNSPATNCDNMRDMLPTREAH